VRVTRPKPDAGADAAQDAVWEKWLVVIFDSWEGSCRCEFYQLLVNRYSRTQAALAELKFARCPRSLTASIAALPSMSLILFAPFTAVTDAQQRPGLSNRIGAEVLTIALLLSVVGRKCYYAGR
jgi:hypothetical protein